MITEDMVREGIRNGSVRFVRDPNMDHGTVCQIGDNWFYFGHLKAEELDPDEYVKATPEADVVGLICNTLDEFRKSGETFEDEYAYYEAYLNEQRAKAIPTLKERDKRLERLWAEFGDVPMNPETEEIEAQFLCFPAGTNREEVWEWFDERYSRGVAKLLLVGEPLGEEVIENARTQMRNFGLEEAELVVRQANTEDKVDVVSLQKSYQELLEEKNRRIGEMSSQLKRYRVTNVEVNDISREVGAMMDNIGAISLTKGITFDVEGTPGDTTLVCVVTPRDSALPVDRETLIRWLRIRTKVENVKLFVEP